jgi:hypothetical protein
VEGASPASVAALERGAVESLPLGDVLSPRASFRHRQPAGETDCSSALDFSSLEAHAEAEAHHQHLQLGDAAMAGLSHLPEAQRLAVAGTLGLNGPATPARVLARRMGTTPEAVEALCAAGLAALRMALEGE